MMENDLLRQAWEARDFAHAWKSGTKVGCVIETTVGDIFKGWNVEGLWMTSIHAEVCAVSQLSGYVGQRIARIAIVAETEFFTPCGACLDWLFQFGDTTTIVIIQNKRNEIKRFTLGELCPHYPKQ